MAQERGSEDCSGGGKRVGAREFYVAGNLRSGSRNRLSRTGVTPSSEAYEVSRLGAISF